MLQVVDLSVYLPGATGEVQVLDRVSFDVPARSNLGVSGESGSGKSMTALAIMGLLPPGARVEGDIVLDGRSLLALGPRQRARLRGSAMAMIFQEPMTALDPVFTIGDQLSEVLRSHEPVSRRAARQRSVEALAAVGIPDPARRAGEYPHQLSGGMRQRAMIAMALICGAPLLIADEPTTAVDITIQSQILELLRELAGERSMSVVFITHDIGVVAELCDQVVVMYAGQVVEKSPTDQLLVAPRHPYTSGLIWAAPRLDDRRTRLTGIPGRVPTAAEFTAGCRFANRCSHVEDACRTVPAQLRVDATGAVRCRRAGEVVLRGVTA